MIQLIRAGVFAAGLVVPTVLTVSWVGSAGERLESAALPTEAGEGVAASGDVARAAPADEGYCSASLKKVLRRVLMSCGLIGGGSGRGCQPVQAKSVATMTGADFNALFSPMKDRGGIIQFDVDKGELDPGDIELLDEIFADQQGASYFFVVARASPEGAVKHNRELSKARAEAVMTHLRETFSDPDLEREVGLLWLGEEYAQLDEGFCEWRRSGPQERCEPDDINRSAFIAWIDCTL